MTEHGFGVDPKGDVFKDLAAVVYAAEGAISGTYVQQSRFAAALLDAHSGGLRGKNVVDMGCGYGTTTVEVARYLPEAIDGVDASPQMVELYREVLTGAGDLRAWLSAKGSETLGPLDGMAKWHLEHMRRDFRSGAFWERRERFVEAMCMRHDDLPVVPYQALVANNFLHWPVNEAKDGLIRGGCREDTATAKAIVDALSDLREWIVPGGVMAVLEPVDFVRHDDPVLQALENRNLSSHPIATAMQQAVNRILESEHGVVRPLLRANPIFRLALMRDLFAAAGLDLVQTAFCETTSFCDPVDAFMVRMPMWLGSVDLPFETKIDIAARADDEVHETADRADMERPIHTECTVFVARKR